MRQQSAQIKIKGQGLRRVALKDLGPRRPGIFRFTATATKWFSVIQADEPATSTMLTVTVGNQCFTHLATRKVE